MSLIDPLKEKLSAYLNAEQASLIERAFHYAFEAHDGQIRRSGEPYITHPVAVAEILADMHMDHQSLMAALMHDVIEDTGISKEEMAEEFGTEVAELVDGVTKLAHISFESRAEQQAENFQKMAMAMAQDLRVILVKLADRLHNMRTLGVLKPEKRRRIAKETLEMYAPIALRLGMNDIRVELEERGFEALYPMRFERLAAARAAVGKNRTELVDEVQEAIRHRMAEEGIEGTVYGREKHLYSIYNKMAGHEAGKEQSNEKSSKKSFSEIMDVFAFRIVTNDVNDCYRALGSVHLLYKPIPGEFKDYIAIPKANGYQSLHTLLVGMHGVPIEVQIRTKDMDAMANTGIAAHWLYKNKRDGDGEIRNTANQNRAQRWVQGLLDIQQNAGSSLEFIENVKIDLFPDEIYLFTPKGKIIELPNGATPVDFAYAVHTDVGNKCIACRVNRRLAPLSEPLRSGQKISIITSEGAQPNPHWLDFVVTAKARSAIRHHLKNQRHHESTSLGKRLLNKALLGFDTKLDDIDAELIQTVLEDNNFSHIDQLFEDIGLGNRVSFAIAKLLCPNSENSGGGNIHSPLLIDATEGMMVSFARCCRPIPGDSVMGHISAGRGLVIHREECRNINDIREQADKCMSLNWAPTVKGEYLVDLRLEVENSRSLIATLATRISEEGANIEKISVDEKDAHNSVINLCLGVSNRIHLANIIRRLRHQRQVIGLSRPRDSLG